MSSEVNFILCSHYITAHSLIDRRFKLYNQLILSLIGLINLMMQAGIPDGVLNVVTGFGHTAGAAISSHMDVDKVIYRIW